MKLFSIFKNKDEKFWKSFYFLTGIIGLLTTFMSISIYRVTIINIFILIFLVLSVGLITFFVNGRRYKITYLINSNIFPFLQNTMSWGLMICYIFLALNYYLPNNNHKEYKFIIKKKSSMPGSNKNINQRQPLVCFDYFNFEKELVFTYSNTDKVNKADSVIIKVQKGLFGFDILESYDVNSTDTQ